MQNIFKKQSISEKDFELVI